MSAEISKTHFCKIETEFFKLKPLIKLVSSATIKYQTYKHSYTLQVNMKKK